MGRTRDRCLGCWHLLLRGHLLLLVLLEGSHEGGLVGRGLEASVAELGGGVDELEGHLLGEPLGGQGSQRFPAMMTSFIFFNTLNSETSN